MRPKPLSLKKPPSSPLQSLPTVKPCPYTDVRLKDAAEKALHIGALVAYPESAFGCINYVGGGGLPSAVEDVGTGSGGLPSATGPKIPTVDGPTPREMALPPQCYLAAPYGQPLPNVSVEGRKLAWCERILVMAESAVTLLDPSSAIPYKTQPFDVDWAVGTL